ncbi:MAG: glycosyltransferase [Saprospiraceae bacterium]|nr:glycosyltransferase [Saprospiraceae bacterium]
MKLLFVGKTDFTYNRDLILLNGLKRRNDVSVQVLQIKKRNWATFKAIRKQSKEVDFVIVPSFRHKDVAFVKWASAAPVLFDPLISKYMTRVLDYGVKWKGPQKYLVDKLAFYWPDYLIWDTEAHQNYLVKKYTITKPNAPIYIGVDTDLFYPIKKEISNKIIVGFYGSFNPLQGIDKIIKTAHLLRNYPNIEFKIIGTGSTYAQVQKLAATLKTSNVEFLGNVPYKDLNAAINQFDICLGVFGESLKTDVVIPNKIYHYAAARKPILTKDTPAIRELFTDQRDIVLTDNQPESMSNAILSLVNTPDQRESIAQNAYTNITIRYNQDQIAELFVKFLGSCSP